MLVHFAVDPDEVYMTTRLSGRATRFLPFNKGYNGGAGNPENPGGYKTSYLWEEVLERHSFLDILARFIHLQIEEKKIGGKKIKRETMIFPRYHQLDCVRKLVADARDQGKGTNYLVQHSAGSRGIPGWPISHYAGRCPASAYLKHQMGHKALSQHGPAARADKGDCINRDAPWAMAHGAYQTSV